MTRLPSMEALESTSVVDLPAVLSDSACKVLDMAQAPVGDSESCGSVWLVTFRVLRPRAVSTAAGSANSLLLASAKACILLEEICTVSSPLQQPQ